MTAGISTMVKEIYRSQITFQYPELVEQYGYDAVWEAMQNSGPVCSTDGKNGCGHEGCHFDCGCVCS